MKRAIPRSRIAPNGTLLSPTSPGQKLPWAPAQLVRSQTDISKIYSMDHQQLGIANAKLRQELRRSASVGNPSMLGSQTLKPSLSPATRQGLEAAIAAVNSPSRNKHNLTLETTRMNMNMSQQINLSQSNNRPNNVSGPSYAAALRARGAGTGGGGGRGENDDSEASHTDQMLMVSLQSDLFDALSKANNAPNDYLRDTQDSTNIIKRPPRSLSEPVIQMPGNCLSSDYFHGNLVNRMGVGALGGVYNPQSMSPSLTFQSQSTGCDSSLQSKSPVLFSPMNRSSAYSSPASRSPHITSMSSSLPLSPFNYAWLSTPSTDATTTQNGQHFFPPLILPASTSTTGSATTTTDKIQTTQRHSYNAQYPNGEVDEGVDSNLVNASQRTTEESITPSPSAWASMLMAPLSPQTLESHQQREQHFLHTKMPPQNCQGAGSVYVQDHQSVHEYPYLYEQHHQQLQQQQQQRDIVSKVHYQAQQQQNQNFHYDESIKYALNDDSESPYPPENQYLNRWACQLGPGVGSRVGSGVGSRSGSLIESLDPQSSASGVTDTDELFTLEDMRLEVLSTECEAHTSSSAYQPW